MRFTTGGERCGSNFDGAPARRNPNLPRFCADSNRCPESPASPGHSEPSLGGTSGISSWFSERRRSDHQESPVDRRERSGHSTGRKEQVDNAIPATTDHDVRRGPVPFGEVGGREAQLVRLENPWLTVEITDFGGALVSLQAIDGAGRRGHVLLGFDAASAYAETPGSFGALLGRNANRIADGKITIDGRTFVLAKNEPNATLHGGPRGFGKCFWSIASLSPERLRLDLTSPDGDQGFPGQVEVTAEYRLIGPALHLVFDATTTKPTPISLSAHPYFNLDGPAADDCLDHWVQIFAERFLPTDEHQIPTGEIRTVAGTPFDFREPRRIGERIHDDDAQLRYGRGYDHYFILPEGGGILRPAARIRAAGSGRVLEILTTQRGLQFYTGNNIDGSVGGRSGLYRQSAGFAFEPQGFPNAINQPNFPSTILRPGELYHEEIAYRFSTEEDAS